MMKLIHKLPAYCIPHIRKTHNTTAQAKQWPNRIFTGVQPTGRIHIGNYFGAIRNLVELQRDGNEILCSVVDLHGITLPYDFKTLPKNILDVTATLLACGMDPNKSTIFLQSQVPEHTQLCWILSCLTNMPKLGQMPQYKEKSMNLKEIPLGLYLYPVLQAADIMLYKATKIPIGQDQIQHLQFTCHTARKFNKRYGLTFPIPSPIIQEGFASRVKNLTDPSKKMSKSYPISRSRIELLDSAEEIRHKFKKALTDCTPKVEYDPQSRPGVSNLVGIHSLAVNRPTTQLCEEASSIDTGQYKMVVAEAVVSLLEPIRNEITKLMNDKGYLVNVLQQGATKAGAISQQTWTEVRHKMGINHF